MMRVLIIEDNETDRELLRYLLESQFEESQFEEAASLREAVQHLECNETDCIILDLQLPDSMGKKTFDAVYNRAPTTPIIVMTNNKDREMALKMIKSGAADYILKDYTDEQDIFNRILLAIERFRHSISLPSMKAVTVDNLNKAKAKMLRAHRQGRATDIRNMTAETTGVIVESSRALFADVQKLTNELVRCKTVLEKNTIEIDSLEKDVLHGRSGNPSIKTQVGLLSHRVEALEKELTDIKNKASAADVSQQTMAIQLQQTQMTNRTKVLIGVISLVGMIITAVATYLLK